MDFVIAVVIVGLGIVALNPITKLINANYDRKQAKIDKMKVCSYCQSVLNLNAKRCQNCGADNPWYDHWLCDHCMILVPVTSSCPKCKHDQYDYVLD